jgi:hypothetical protein
LLSPKGFYIIKIPKKDVPTDPQSYIDRDSFKKALPRRAVKTGLVQKSTEA